MVFAGLTYGLLGPALPIFIQQLVGPSDRPASIVGTITGVGAFSAAVSALVRLAAPVTASHRRALLRAPRG